MPAKTTIASYIVAVVDAFQAEDSIVQLPQCLRVIVRQNLKGKSDEFLGGFGNATANWFMIQFAQFHVTASCIFVDTEFLKLLPKLWGIFEEVVHYSQPPFFFWGLLMQFPDRSLCRLFLFFWIRSA